MLATLAGSRKPVAATASTAAAVATLSLAASAAFSWNWAMRYRSSLVFATACAAATFCAICGGVAGFNRILQVDDRFQRLRRRLDVDGLGG